MIQKQLHTQNIRPQIKKNFSNMLVTHHINPLAYTLYNMRQPSTMESGRGRVRAYVRADGQHSTPSTPPKLISERERKNASDSILNTHFYWVFCGV